MPSIKRILSDLTLFRREYLRNWSGFFFALIFPIILIAIFGAIFSGGSSGPVTIYAQNQDSPSQYSTLFIHVLNSTNATRVVLVDNSENLSEYLLSHSYSEGILIPKGFSSNFTSGNHVNVTMYTNPADTSSQIVIGVTSAIINQFNLRGSPPTIGIHQLPIKSSLYKYIDFLIPGLIGFSILTSPMFSMVNISSEYKKNKIFKQLSLTPLTKGEWLASKIIWYTLLSMISFILMVTVGILAFGAHITLSVWIIPFLLLGPLFFVALGMLVGSITKTVESAGVIGNIITFPMMFLSGTFFPVSIMPVYLQHAVYILPLYYVIDGLNAVMVYNDYSQALVDILVLVVISTMVFSLAVRFFKWRED